MNDEQTVLGLAMIRRNRGISSNRSPNRQKSVYVPWKLSSAESFGNCPGGIYNTSYIRQYARAIDYDEGAILAVYHREMRPAESRPGTTRLVQRFPSGVQPSLNSSGV